MPLIYLKRGAFVPLSDRYELSDLIRQGLWRMDKCVLSQECEDPMIRDKSELEVR
jgi:hypothetical protein